MAGSSEFVGLRSSGIKLALVWVSQLLLVSIIVPLASNRRKNGRPLATGLCGRLTPNSSITSRSAGGWKIHLKNANDLHARPYTCKRSGMMRCYRIPPTILISP